MKNNIDVIRGFMEGYCMSTRTLRTDGKCLYSYNLLIGETTPNGIKVVYNYTKKGNKFISHSTSSHVGMAVREGASLITLYP